MEFAGQVTISAPPADVWAALFDPEILQHCIPGCKSVERKSDTEFTLVTLLKVGPLTATFSGVIRLEDPDHEKAVTLAGSAQGAAGFAKGQARIIIASVAPDTQLAYRAELRIGGKLAVVGDRLFGAAVRRNTTEFFAALEKRITAIAQLDDVRSGGAGLRSC